MAANNVVLTGDGIRGKSGKNTVGLAPGFPKASIGLQSRMQQSWHGGLGAQVWSTQQRGALWRCAPGCPCLWLPSGRAELEHLVLLWVPVMGICLERSSRAHTHGRPSSRRSTCPKEAWAVSWRSQDAMGEVTKPCGCVGNGVSPCMVQKSHYKGQR